MYNQYEKKNKKKYTKRVFLFDISIIFVYFIIIKYIKGVKTMEEKNKSQILKNVEDDFKEKLLNLFSTKLTKLYLNGDAALKRDCPVTDLILKLAVVEQILEDFKIENYDEFFKRIYLGSSKIGGDRDE